VTARNTDVIWPSAIEGSFILGRDNRVTYTPPPAIGTYEFTVVAAADPSRTVTARITVVHAPPEITISPANPPEIKTAKTFQFTAATVIPVGQPQQEPTWEVQGDCGTISQDGLFSAAARFGPCTVRARIRDNNNRIISDSVQIRITELSLDDILRDMVHVRGGTFTMGCTPEQENECSSGEIPAHQVTLNDFHIGRYPVTYVVWGRIMGWNNPPRTSWNLPVENVSWDEVQTFITALNNETGRNFRLPTEAEWEYAARGGDQSRRHMYSGSNNLDDVGWYIGNSDSSTQPVGMKRANELGIHDMSGNVSEWVNDRYGPYGGDPLNNPIGPTSGTSRVVRGGSSVSPDAIARVSFRGGWEPSRRHNFLGFRLAITTTR
jgi:formylglycine-generating enzyme required for sulfatase activity